MERLLGVVTVCCQGSQTVLARVSLVKNIPSQVFVSCEITFNFLSNDIKLGKSKENESITFMLHTTQRTE